MIVSSFTSAALKHRRKVRDEVRATKILNMPKPPLRPLESAEKYRLADFVIRDRSDSDIVQDVVDAFIKMRGAK